MANRKYQRNLYIENIVHNDPKKALENLDYLKRVTTYEIKADCRLDQSYINHLEKNRVVVIKGLIPTLTSTGMNTYDALKKYMDRAKK